MNRNQLKEVASSHPSKAEENKVNNRKEYSSLYYNQNKEEINRQRRARRKLKKVEPKVTLTSTNLSEKATHVKVENGTTKDNSKWTKERNRDYHRKYKNEQRAQSEGLTNAPFLPEEVLQSKEYNSAKELITQLETNQASGQVLSFPQLKKTLLVKSQEFQTVFAELLKANRSQYRHLRKMRIPLTLPTLKKWQEETQQIPQPTIARAQKPKGVRRFLYEITHNRLWYQSKEVKNKTLTQWGRFRFIIENDPTTNSYFFLEPQLEKDWQLRVYAQEAQQGELHHFRTFGSYQDTQIVNFAIQEWDEIIKNGEGKWEKKWNSDKDTLPLLSKGAGKTLSI